MYRKILAPLDGSAFSECALEHVKAIASGCAVPHVVLLRVVEPIHPTELSTYIEAGIDTTLLMRETRQAAEAYVSRMTAQLQAAGLTAEGVIATGRAADEILGYAAGNGVDLIIMSTHGRGGVGRWFMGSVTDKVVRHAVAPVLTVAPPGCRVDEPE